MSAAPTPTPTFLPLAGSSYAVINHNFTRYEMSRALALRCGFGHRDHVEYLDGHGVWHPLDGAVEIVQQPDESLRRDWKTLRALELEEQAEAEGEDAA